MTSLALSLSHRWRRSNVINTSLAASLATAHDGKSFDELTNIDNVAGAKLRITGSKVRVCEERSNELRRRVY